MFGAAWAALPADAAIRLDFADLDYARYASLSLEGVTPQSAGLFLAPFVGELQEARAESQAKAVDGEIEHPVAECAGRRHPWCWCAI